jgi:hypothetical protein
MDTYGYSAETIIDCLDYVYNILKKQKKVETIYIVNPTTLDQRMRYKGKQNIESLNLAAAAQTEIREYIVPIKENTNGRKKITYDPDEWLDD